MLIPNKFESVAVFQSELYQTNSYVIETEDLVLVIDPGYLPSEIVSIRDYVDQVKGSRPLYLFFTHSDFDHIAGYGTFTDCITIAGEAFAECTDRQQAINAVLELDDQYYIRRPYDIAYPRVDYVVREEGQSLVIGSTVIAFYSAKGHNSDSMMCYIESSKLLITGDYLSDIEFPFIFDTFANYQNTLSKLRQMKATYPDLILLPSHGSVTDDSAEIDHRILASETYFQIAESSAQLQENDDFFQKFMLQNNYHFTKGLTRRHEANLEVLSIGGKQL